MQEDSNGGRMPWQAGTAMTVTTCYSTGRVETSVMRGLGDNDERRLIISCPWGQLPIQTYMAIRHQLTDEEIAEVRKAFGWDGEPSIPHPRS